jgi:type VI secretion system secreted protein VgrG
MAMHRVMEVITPLGDDLLFHRLHAREEVSRLSELELDLLSLKGNINLDDVVGKSFTVKLELPDSKTRYFNSYVTRFGQTGMHGRYHVYHATLRPWLWFLTRTSDCRIFQEQTVPDIIKKVFGDHGAADFKFDLTAKYRKWDYCVQYRETDFNFVSRLMEQEGFYYYFTHDDGRHTMVLADSYSKHSPFPGYEEVHFITSDKLKEPEQDHVSDWHFSREIQPAVYAIDDYDFERPSVELVTKQKATRKHDHADCEVYDYPGEYIQKADGDTYAQTRLDELQTQFELAHGRATRGGCAWGARSSWSGSRATISREYIVLSATHIGWVRGYDRRTRAARATAAFSVLSTKQQYARGASPHLRLVRRRQSWGTRWGRDPPTSTAAWVQFHWDRATAEKQNSSCWVRFHPWAGKNWGMSRFPASARK